VAVSHHDATLIKQNIEHHISGRNPRGLGKRGRKAWAELTRTYVFNPAEVLLVEEIAHTADLLEDIEAQLLTAASARPSNPFSSKPGAPQGLTVRGSTNQPRAHPLLHARVEAEATLAGLVQALALPELPAQAEQKALPVATTSRPKAV
jgi:hypothetical protein